MSEAIARGAADPFHLSIFCHILHSLNCLPLTDIYPYNPQPQLRNTHTTISPTNNLEHDHNFTITTTATMSTVDPKLTDDGTGESSFVWGDNIPSDSGDDEYTPSSDEDSSTETSDIDPMEICELEDDDSSTKNSLDDPMEIDENRPAGIAGVPGLLKVSGEIRNMIYSHMPDAAGDTRDITHGRDLSKQSKYELYEPAPRVRHLTSGGKISFGKPPSECTDWSQLRQQFLGLTQVNRQLRKEALTSRDGFVHGVFLDQLEAYIADFYVNSARNLNQLSWTRIHFLMKDAVDVKSLSLFMARLPKPVGPVFYRQNLPAWVFSNRVSAEWVSYLETHVSRLLVRTDQNMTPRWVDILVHEDHAEDWMCTWNGKGTVPVEQAAWLDKYGLDCRPSVKLAVSMDWEMSGYVLTEFEIALLS